MLHSPRMSIVIAPEHWRNGLWDRCSTRSAALSLQLYACANVVHASCADWNEAARHFASSLGYTEAGRERWVGLRDGQPYDEIMIDILRREWEERDHATGR